ncbi:MAG: PDZ domain-containing protein [Actinobacteria bacterium]|nr:MAG: PDZ domain-containing protein [Actinomycetota bacterium]
MAPQSTLQQIAASAGPSVVGLAEGARGGSGVVVEPGRVLTLARNLRGGQLSVALSGGRLKTATVAGTDADRGIAVLELDTGETPAVTWADGAEAPAIGAPVFALADPAGRGLRVTAGAVASAPQALRGPRGRLLEGLIEHTAPLPRGSGGGPLLDGQGRLLGLNAVRLAHGLILALPTAEVRERVADIAAGKPATQRRLGVAIVAPRIARRLRGAVGLPEREGVLVRAVQQQSPAARAGVERGDLIVAMAGREVDSLDALFAALDAAPLEQPVPLRILRGEQERQVDVVLGGS